MMTDSSSDSEDDFFLLAALALSLDFWAKKTDERKTLESKSPPFLLDLLGASRPLSPLR